MGIIGTIFIGLIVGLLARFINCWVLPAPCWLPMVARHWVYTRLGKRQASLARWSVPWCCW